MAKKKRKPEEGKEKIISYLTILLIIGILIMTLGVYLVGIHFPKGNIILMIGSLIVYILIIILALFI